MQLLNKVLEMNKKSNRVMKLALAEAADDAALKAVVEARKLGLAEPVLFGIEDDIKRVAQENDLDLSGIHIVHCEDMERSAEEAVKSVSSGETDFLMKGLLDTSVILKAALNKDWGIRGESLLSHVMVYEMAAYKKPLILTDGGVNIAPNLEEKVKILENAIQVSRAIGNELTKVGAIAAKEKVSDKMPATVDAAELQKMSEAGAFGEDVIVEGPMAIDLAYSKEAAIHKGFESRVAGDIDIMLCPNIEMGNGVSKTFTYLAGAESAGVIMGARKPIVIVSRADSYDSKLNSIALACLVASL